MIKRVYDKIVLECDGCSTTLDTHSGEFSDAREIMREEGWESFKLGHTWRHYCAECANVGA